MAKIVSGASTNADGDIRDASTSNVMRMNGTLVRKINSQRAD
jgi:hypothetical protein